MISNISSTQPSQAFNLRTSQKLPHGTTNFNPQTTNDIATFSDTRQSSKHLPQFAGFVKTAAKGFMDVEADNVKALNTKIQARQKSILKLEKAIANPETEVDKLFAENYKIEVETLRTEIAALEAKLPKAQEDLEQAKFTWKETPADE